MANKAAMAAAMGGTAPEAGQDAPRRERGDRGRRNDGQGEARGERQDFGDAAPAELTAGLDANASADNQTQGDQADAGDQRQPREPRERRSRDRYGRERRERGDAAPSGERSNAEASDSAPLTGSNSLPAQQSLLQNEPADQVIRAQAAPELIAKNAVQPTASAPAPVASFSVAASAAPAGLPKVQAYDLPLQDLAVVAQTSGLQWVNSDASKIAEVKAAMALEAKPTHVPRERPPQVAQTQAPLVLVETKRDLKDMQLPFEKT